MDPSPRGTHPGDRWSGPRGQGRSPAAPRCPHGTIVDNTVEEKDGVWHVTNATHGTFPLIVDGSREPSHVAFRWAPWDERAVTEGNTLVEFFLEGPDEGPVTVRVLESGFASIQLDAADVAANYRENESGWEAELGALKAHLEAR